jgi:uncharacterized membrane protein
LAAYCYVAVLLLQPLWLGLLPAPLGRQNWGLALLAVLPLLLPLRGILAGQPRSMTWGGYLLVLYFVIGVMEAWSSPAQRAPALAQAVLAVVYVIGLMASSRRPRHPR